MAKFWWMLAMMMSLGAALSEELPPKGFRAVTGGASPDGRWVISVLESSQFKFLDELPDTHQHAYLLDLHSMKAVSKLPKVDTLGGYHGRPETNVNAKWFADSKYVCVGWRSGRLNHGFAVFSISKDGVLSEAALPDPMKVKDGLFSQLKAHSNCGSYLDKITPEGELIVVYYGYWPVRDEFHKTDSGKLYDHNRIEVIYAQKDAEKSGQWMIKSVASPGIHAPVR